ncbi:hypothetical protein I305_04360 [Cryptococcus gattii E566]|uniref:Ricin B lectin domain-containing protein n=2 Tax=Cryptococcus gattii TaxID=37769 RepID=E6R653_CRYGW|nr:Hypothetical protein CGB_E6260W [Cryptococcus gattii WM276]ADV22683.1 Hypothetical protein CGB_E6260W [Cryptococcus gattii WM276]KIR78275.1 hypothetical protein I306_04717 [Cryptococcus gattii EJB2]KIY33033.1 hypothetical protein I305_04360 [Cryptococcus gattii E566]KJE00669.1 hypothetical protein I311_05719 [Cryptococcus gattii NT-10]
MVFGLLTAIAACPAIIGTTEAIQQGQKANAREQHRGRKTNLTIKLPGAHSYKPKFEGCMVVLHDKKLYVDHANCESLAYSHPFQGYYLPHPQNQSRWKGAGWKGEGMVTTINEDNMLNWVYVDANTYELKHGVRAEAQDHLTGPWDCTQIDRRVTFEGWEGFVLVQEDEEKDLWALYFDKDDDGLAGEGKMGDVEANGGKRRRMLEVQLVRTEMEKTRYEALTERRERIQALQAKMREQQE